MTTDFRSVQNLKGKIKGRRDIKSKDGGFWSIETDCFLRQFFSTLDSSQGAQVLELHPIFFFFFKAFYPTT